MHHYKIEKLLFLEYSPNVFILFSLDQLLVSVGDQQRLQSVLLSARSKSTILTLMQEAKAQSEVSEMQRTRGHRTAATSVPSMATHLEVCEPFSRSSDVSSQPNLTCRLL